MFSKQHLLATVVATVTMFILGYLIWGVATVDYFEGHTVNNVMKDPPPFPWIIFANLIAAFCSLCHLWQVGPRLSQHGRWFSIRDLGWHLYRIRHGSSLVCHNRNDGSGRSFGISCIRHCLLRYCWCSDRPNVQGYTT